MEPATTTPLDEIEAADILRTTALHYYNRSVASRYSDDQIGVLTNAIVALHLYPYEEDIVFNAMLQCLQHGLYELTARIVLHARHLQIKLIPQEVETELAIRVDEWNKYLSNPELLRHKYNSANSERNYRELNLLVKHFGASLTDTELGHVRAVGIPTNDLKNHHHQSHSSPIISRVISFVGWSLAAAVVVLAIGITMPERGPDRTPQMAGPLVEILTYNGSNLFVRATMMILADPFRPRPSLALIDSVRNSADIPPQALQALESQLEARLHEEIDVAWREKDCSRLVSLLDEAGEKSFSPEELYRLGMAASCMGDSSRCVELLERSLELATTKPPYWAPQALYTLALNSSRSRSQRYAATIRDQFGESIFFNSKVREILSRDQN